MSAHIGMKGAACLVEAQSVSSKSHVGRIRAPDRAKVLHDLDVLAADCLTFVAAWVQVATHGLSLADKRRVVRVEIGKLNAISRMREAGL